MSKEQSPIFPVLNRADIFKALGDPTRLRLFEFLRDCCCPVAVEDSGAVRPVEGPTVGEACCSVTGADQITSTISRHLRELKLAGLITIERRGKNQICGIRHEVIAELAAYFAAEKPTDETNSGSGPCC